MIKSFKHKGLKRFFETGNTAGIIPEHEGNLRNCLAAIHQAEVITDLSLPSLRLHRLKGDRKNVWSVTVRANWRITFEFTDGDAYILNYEDYH
ncbi:type II toxin-antitoxin system RelE/ParE family toxin [Pantoea agglomerans]|uniref:type II toxin-antitoxin system RelE/ParE family toxin n=1 Tax=Enterobacter agglomerans TaxID=549 RepID=UPI001F4E33E2|nr:type II toxin-antitoxin system RelE/ParE family toxin [Pantoea agglomerans]MCH9408654.1 type II toxin-antitoxin system RelE/ParE family toxin [Pantoea agglomerans]